MWLTGRLVPDHKTIADFRRDNGTAIREVCARSPNLALQRCTVHKHRNDEEGAMITAAREKFLR